MRNHSLSIPFAASREVQNRARYSWDCERRGNTPFVILQYSLAGSGRFQVGGATYDVPAESAFIALVPEKARYFYPPEGSAQWTFCWLNFYNPFSIQLWKPGFPRWLVVHGFEGLDGMIFRHWVHSSSGFGWI
jgi:hypothetical protein